MNMEELGYILYMESQKLQNKDYDKLTENEKVNLKLNPFFDDEITTKDEEVEENEEIPINTPLP